MGDQPVGIVQLANREDDIYWVLKTHGEEERFAAAATGCRLSSVTVITADDPHRKNPVKSRLPLHAVKDKFKFPQWVRICKQNWREQALKAANVRPLRAASITAHCWKHQSAFMCGKQPRPQIPAVVG